MKIISEEIQIPKTETLTSEYIEHELSLKGIEPLRWAIVKVETDCFVVNVSYCVI